MVNIPKKAADAVRDPAAADIHPAQDQGAGPDLGMESAIWGEDNYAVVDGVVGAAGAAVVTPANTQAA